MDWLRKWDTLPQEVRQLILHNGADMERFYTLSTEERQEVLNRIRMANTPDELDAKDEISRNRKSPRTFSSGFNIIFKSLPIIGVVITVLILIIIGKQLTLDDIMRFRMDNLWLASAYLICAYAIKSILIVVPLNLLMIAGGMFFNSQWLSLIVNTIGVAVCLCIPYWLGRLIGKRATDKFIEKYDKRGIIAKIGRIQSENSFFISYIMRIIGFIPCDVLSLYMGASRISFLKYITGGILGCVPSIITVTLVGATITEPGSPVFIISVVIHLLLSILSSLIYRKFLKKRGGKQNEQV